MPAARFLVRSATLEDLTKVVGLRQELALSDGEGDPFVNRCWAVTEGVQVFKRVILATMEKKECCVVAVVDHDVVAYLEGGWKECASWRPVRATELRTIFVKEQFRRQGIGRRLVSEFLQWSKEQQAQAAEIDVFSSNRRAIAFYKRLGFRPTFITVEILVEDQA
jgi:GNAT superfamily N-acetyltransferase